MFFKGRASNGDGKTFTLIPAGTHPAVLVAIYDIGTHDKSYKGEPPKPTRQVVLAWELTQEKDKDGAPLYIGRLFTYSYHEKAGLRQMLERWRGAKYPEGAEIDILATLGKPCLLSVGHSVSGDRTFANVEGVSALPKGMDAGKPQASPFAWSITEGLVALKDGKPVTVDAAAAPPDWEWIPYVYGAHPKDHVKECHEMRGEGVTAAAGHAPAPPAGATTAPDPIPF